MNTTLDVRSVAGWVMVGALLCLPAHAADPVSDSISAQKQIVTDASQSQKRIDKLADQTSELVNEYKNLLRQTEALTAYNDQNEKIVRAQREEVASINRQIATLEQTRTEVVPLMLRMISALEDFVAADMPFLLEERQQRVVALKALMDRADVSTSEKYRKILEAYQIENDFGQTIESYQASLGQGDDTRTYSFLRIGRIALLYQTPDGAETGHWNKDAKSWEKLDDTYRSPVSEGLKIARKQAPPALIKLPVLGPRDGK